MDRVREARGPSGRLQAAADAGRALRDRNFGEGLGALSLVGSVWATVLGRLTTDRFEQKREPVPRAR